MKKIPTLFKRNLECMSEVLNELNPECEWVLKGEGTATRKYDGTCCKIEKGLFLKRREIKLGKLIPKDFIEEEFDPNTGKYFGWVHVYQEDKYHVEAFLPTLEDGTYELCGPKVQGNPEKLENHVLISHKNAEVFADCPRDFEKLKEWFLNKDIEGIVFHHPDGRMAKIRKRDFGLKRI